MAIARARRAGSKTDQLHEVIERTVARGGKVVIPSFAVGRTQALLARINDLVEGGKLSGLKVYVDSPMAIEATSVFAMFPDAYSEEARRLMRCGDEPLDFPGLTMTCSVDESKAINADNDPSVIISALRDGHGRADQASPGELPLGLEEHDPVRRLPGGEQSRDE